MSRHEMPFRGSNTGENGKADAGFEALFRFRRTRFRQAEIHRGLARSRALLA